MEVIEMQHRRFKLNDEAFFQFCQDNTNLRFERDIKGTIFIMPNTGGKTGEINSLINYFFVGWNLNQRSGRIFDSSTAFRLPSTAVRSPNLAWISNEQWAQLTETEQAQFPPLCPDFVLELVAATDDIKQTKQKIQQEWIENSCRLAWLIDPKGQTAHIYRANGEIQIVPNFDQTLSGEDVLVGFKLDLKTLKG